MCPLLVMSMTWVWVRVRVMAEKVDVPPLAAAALSALLSSVVVDVSPDDEDESGDNVESDKDDE